jgi:hypothetical protein
MMSPCLVRVTNPTSLSGPWIIKPVDFRGLPQNQSSSILKTDQFLVKTKTIYCKKWFSISFTDWFLPVLKTDRFLIFQSMVWTVCYVFCTGTGFHPPRESNNWD